MSHVDDTITEEKAQPADMFQHDEQTTAAEMIPKTAENTIAAGHAAQYEHQLGLIESIRLYPKAIMFSVIMSLGIVMEGYDTSLLGSFYAQPAFQLRFGDRVAADGTHQVSAPWQAGLSNGANVGEILGLVVAGILAERYGYKKTLIGSLIMLIGAIFICFFAVNLGMLFAGEVLCGIPVRAGVSKRHVYTDNGLTQWGAFQTLTTTYAADVTPLHLRHILTSFVNLCWVTGQLISAGVLRGVVDNTTQWGWRIPYAIQWAWPLPILVGLVSRLDVYWDFTDMPCLLQLFAPESPWWLVRKGREEDARRSLTQLTSPRNTAFNADDTIAMMIHTNEYERQLTQGTTYWDCFKGTNLRRTEIACMVWISQVTVSIFKSISCTRPTIGLLGLSNMLLSRLSHPCVGSQLTRKCSVESGSAETSPTFSSSEWRCESALQTSFLITCYRAGFEAKKSFDFGLGENCLGWVGTVLSWFVMARVGRRKLFVIGMGTLFVILLAIGFLGIPKVSPAIGYTQAALLCLYVFTYDITVGPTVYALVSEMPSTRLRIKTVVIARNCYNIASICANELNAPILNPTAWNLRGKGGFVWCGFCFISFVWAYFRLPEPKGLIAEEIDILFEKKVAARKFHSVQVEAFVAGDAQ